MRSAIRYATATPNAKKRGYFLMGKYDPLKRNIPYSAIVSAFQGLVQQLLTESEKQLQQWREKLLAALQQQGQVIIDVIPELELIIGKQPALPKLSSTEWQNRFIFVFQNFIRVFCQPEHPLVIFLDDLHWTDTATLKLIERILTDVEARYLLLIGAYREREVNPSHPLAIAVNEFRKKRFTLNQITLGSLSLKSVNQLIADTLHAPTDSVKDLAKIVYRKTEGNPFFVKDFLQYIYAHNLILFDFYCLNWRWDMAKIEAMNITDNVVELLINKLKNLPESTQNILRLAACVGNNFDLNTLSIICEKLPSELVQDLVIAVEGGLIQAGEDYKFTHDRLQQAAYNLIDETQKRAVHLQIGRLLLQNSTPETLSDKIFEIVSHLNLGVGVWRDLSLSYGKQTQARTPISLDEIAFLNLIAGQKALAEAAYGIAFKYLNAGIELLGKNSWLRAYNLTLEMYDSAVEAAYLNGDFQQQNQLTEVVLQKAKNKLEKVKVYHAKIQAYGAQNQAIEAVNNTIKFLKLLGIDFPENPSESDIQMELEKTISNLASRGNIDDLIHLPEMTDPCSLAAMGILASATTMVYQAVPELFPLIIFKQINLSVTYGNAPLSAFAYVVYGLILCGVVKDIESGYQFGKLAENLLAKFHTKAVTAKVIQTFNCLVRNWKDHIRETLKPLLEAYSVGLETGDFEFAALSLNTYCYAAYFMGRELTELQQELTTYSNALWQIKQERIFYRNEIYRQIVLNLLGYAENPCRLIGEAYDEEKMLPLHLEANDTCAILYLYFCKLQLCYLLGNYSQAMENAAKVEEYLNGGIGQIVIPQFHFYDSLTGLAAYRDLTQDKSSC